MRRNRSGMVASTRFCVKSNTASKKRTSPKGLTQVKTSLQIPKNIPRISLREYVEEWSTFLKREKPIWSDLGKLIDLICYYVRECTKGHPLHYYSGVDKSLQSSPAGFWSDDNVLAVAIFVMEEISRTQEVGILLEKYKLNGDEVLDPDWDSEIYRAFRGSIKNIVTRALGNPRVSKYRQLKNTRLLLRIRTILQDLGVDIENESSSNESDSKEFRRLLASLDRIPENVGAKINSPVFATKDLRKACEVFASGRKEVSESSLRSAISDVLGAVGGTYALLTWDDPIGNIGRTSEREMESKDGNEATTFDLEQIPSEHGAFWGGLSQGETTPSGGIESLHPKEREILTQILKALSIQERRWLLLKVEGISGPQNIMAAFLGANNRWELKRIENRVTQKLKDLFDSFEISEGDHQGRLISTFVTEISEPYSNMVREILDITNTMERHYLYLRTMEPKNCNELFVATYQLSLSERDHFLHELNNKLKPIYKRYEFKEIEEIEAIYSLMAPVLIQEKIFNEETIDEDELYE